MRIKVVHNYCKECGSHVASKNANMICNKCGILDKSEYEPREHYRTVNPKQRSIIDALDDVDYFDMPHEFKKRQVLNRFKRKSPNMKIKEVERAIEIALENRRKENEV